MSKSACFMLPDEGQRCFILLGRYGDLIQMLPAFKVLRDRHGKKPVVYVGAEYASVFDGVSYVEPRIVNLPWVDGTPRARGIAEMEHPWVSALQFWNDSKEQFKSEVGRRARVIQCQGSDWMIDGEKWPDYGSAMWNIAGFTREQMLTLPLEFDQRDGNREAELAKPFLHRFKPTILFNWKGVSSPFPHAPEFQCALAKFRQKFHLVDLSTIKAHRIYDLLGLYDRAAALVTVDTATLHLAHASGIPCVSFTRGDWSGSVPKGNCILDIKYHEACGSKRVLQFERAIGSLVRTQEPVPA